jgi:hypothetical protein
MRLTSSLSTLFLRAASPKDPNQFPDILGAPEQAVIFELYTAPYSNGLDTVYYPSNNVWLQDDTKSSMNEPVGKKSEHLSIGHVSRTHSVTCSRTISSTFLPSSLRFVMARSKIYFTKREKREAHRLSSKRSYNKWE